MEGDAGDLQTEGAAAPPPPSPEPTLPMEEDYESHEYEEEEEEEEDDEEETNNEDEILIAKAQELIDKIIASPNNPNPIWLHALASILETQEARYMEETGHSSLNNDRASYNIGSLGNLLQDNNEFIELISEKFLSEPRYPISVKSAALRLLYSCSLTWMYPHIFEETVLENIKGWVMDGSTEDHIKQSSDSEMLKTYSTGLLAVCLAGGGQVVEDVLTSGLSAKLMRYLRIRVLGETSTSQKESKFLLDNKNSSAVTIRSRFRHASEPSRITEEGSTDDRWTEVDGVDEDNETCDGKTRVNDRSTPGKNWGVRDRSLVKSLELRCGADVNKSSGRVGGDGLNVERDDRDDCFQDCKVGSKDIIEIVKMAVRAAEGEARTANASVEAIRAVGDAAAELVKTAAFEEFKKANDEEAAFLSASQAASMVVDAANATQVSRNCNTDVIESANPKEPEPETNEETEDFFIPDCEHLTKLREKFCIQCLEILGEYIDVLGPVLHEKGVDVCIALLQQNSDLKEPSQIAVILPDVLKLICALTAHRKIAELFVDRGGIQNLLAIPRTPLTFSGLSSCLFAIGSLQGVMERVCALPSDFIHQLIELALQVIECPQDQARKNSALFFAAAFVFRAVIDAFDNQNGLQKLLNPLHEAASVRSGATSATGAPTSSEKQIAYHTTVALRQYFRAHLLLRVDSIRCNKKFKSALGNVTSSRAAYKPLDISNEAIDAVVRQIQKDDKLGPAFVRDSWIAVEKFLKCNGHVTMLELCQAPPVDRYLHDLLQYALGILHIVTLVPSSHKLVASVALSNDRLGIAIVLDAAASVDPEIIQASLNVLVNLVCPPSSNGSSTSMPTVKKMEKGYYQEAREAVRANNGIKALIELLQPRTITTQSTALDRVRSLACRVLLGLARDDTIAHILTKLQVGKKLSELVRDDCGSQTPGGEQGRWQTELSQVAIELMAVVTNSGRASTLAATPTLRRIEKAAIADATPITYPSTELLLLIHEHLQASGLSTTASQLLKEAQLTPLQIQTSSQQIQWPSSSTFLTTQKSKQQHITNHSSFSSTSPPLSSPSTTKITTTLKTPPILPLKRKLTDSCDVGPSSSSKRLHTGDPQLNTNGSTLDSIVIDYLKHQHHHCPAPITTLPPLSLLHPHVCPEPKTSINSPPNITARLNTREFRNNHGGIHGGRRDRQFVYSRFRPWRTCRDDSGDLLTCITFLNNSSQIAAGSHSGELKIFDTNSNNILESNPGHDFPLTMVKSFISSDTQLLLSSSSHDVKLWDPLSVSAGPKYSFDGIKAADFSHCGTMFAGLSTELSRREILVYDVVTCKSDLKLTDPFLSKGHGYSQVHFSPSDIMIMWNGVLWDRRVQGPVHRFDQFTDYGGGGFHPAGNEVIINSEVWDLRKFKLVRSVPSLDQTVITFNASGDVIYAILRRNNLEDVTSAFHSRLVKHPLFSAFRTIDAVNYSDVATCPVDRCVLDFATEPTDSFVGLVTMDDQDDMYSSARVYEIGRRKPTDDDSDPDDAESEEEEEDENDDVDIDVDGLFGNDEDGDTSNDDDISNSDDDDSVFDISSEEGDDNEMNESSSSGDDEDSIGWL